MHRLNSSILRGMMGSLAIWALLGIKSAAAQLVDSGIALEGVRASTVAWGDIDKDGDLDLIIAGIRSSGERLTRIYKNDGSGNFPAASASDLTTAAIAFGQVGWADMDNNGFLDLAVAGFGEKTLASATLDEISDVFRNDNGSLSIDPDQLVERRTRLPTKTDFRYCALGWVDYDRDGATDLLLTGLDRNGFVASILYRNENNTLIQDRRSVIVAVQKGALAWGDFDNDGDPDLAITGIDAARKRTTRVYINEPTGLFSEENSFDLIPLYKGALAWGDLDGDGHLDLAVSGWDENWNAIARVYRNNPQRRLLENPVDLPTPMVGALAWADYDNDGDPDLAVSGQDQFGQAQTLIYQNSNGILSPAQSLTGLRNGALAWGDYDGNHTLDLIVSGEDDNGTPKTMIYRNTGSANTPPDPPATLLDPVVTSNSVTFRWKEGHDAQTPDIKLTYQLRVGSQPGLGDLITDITPPGPGDAGQVLRQTLFRSLPLGSYYWSVRTIDGGFLSSDEAPEQTFEVQQFVSSGQTLIGLRQTNLGHGIAWGDFDNDGDLDLVIQGRNLNGDHLALLYRNEKARLVLDANAADTLFGLRNGVVTWGDFDNDGDLDLYQTGADRNDNAGVMLYRNEPTGTLIPFLGRIGGAPIGGVNALVPMLDGADAAWGDYDNDGDLDLIVTGIAKAVSIPEFGISIPQTTTLTLLYRNEPLGTLLPDTTQQIFHFGAGGVAWGDYDNDGDLDLALTGLARTPAGQFGPTTALYRNEPTGTLTLDSELLGLQFSALAWGDYDNDGDLDLAVTGIDQANQFLTRLYNNDQATFSEDNRSNLPGVAGGALAWGDYDNDGDLDLVISGQDPTGATITKTFTNEGTGLFTEQAFAALRGAIFSSVAWVDYDNDRDLDLTVTGGSGSNATEFSALYDNLRSRTDPNSAPLPPSGLTAVTEGNTVTLSWQPPFDDTTPSAALTYILRVGTAPGTEDIVSSRLANGFGPLKQTSVKLTNLASQTYFWSVQAVDNGLRQSREALESSFVIDTIPPQVGSAVATPGSVGINQTINVVVNFLEEGGMDNTVSPTVTFLPAGADQPIALTQLSYTGNGWSGTATIDATNPSGEAVVAVKNAVDAKGNTLVPSDSAGTFMIDTVVPQVQQTIPGPNQEGVFIETKIAAHFSEPMNKSMIENNTTFEVKSLQTGRSIDGEITYRSADSTAVFTPKAKLDSDTGYEVMLRGEFAKDLVGNRLSGDVRWTFHTALTVASEIGAKISNEGRTVELYVPPKAIDEDEQIAIERLSPAAIDAIDFDHSTLTSIDIGVKLTPPLTLKGNKPAILTLRYQSLPAGVDESTLAIFQGDPRDNPTRWQRIGGTVNADSNLVRTAVTTLGSFALFADSNPTVSAKALDKVNAQPRAFAVTGASRAFVATGASRALVQTDRTTLSFALGKATPVTIEVYNITGRLVRVICRDKPLLPGTNTEQWDGKDDEGRPVPSGFYIVVIDTGEAREKISVAVVNKF